jgi:hypothetical protein
MLPCRMLQVVFVLLRGVLAGLGGIGLLTGGWSNAELAEAGAVAVYESPADLLHRLAESPCACARVDSGG